MNTCSKCQKQVWYRLLKLKFCKACYARDYYAKNREKRIQAVRKHQITKHYSSPYHFSKIFYERRKQKRLALLALHPEILEIERQKDRERWKRRKEQMRIKKMMAIEQSI